MIIPLTKIKIAKPVIIGSCTFDYNQVYIISFVLFISNRIIHIVIICICISIFCIIIGISAKQRIFHIRKTLFDCFLTICHICQTHCHFCNVCRQIICIRQHHIIAVQKTRINILRISHSYIIAFFSKCFLWKQQYTN